VGSHLLKYPINVLIRFREYLASKKALVEPIRGLKKLLTEANQKNVPLVCVTNACRANAEFMLKHLEIESHFQNVVIGEECERPKVIRY
jgi:beta-phosphoglucomutase-like phosphatase (HAD superfamily)